MPKKTFVSSEDFKKLEVKLESLCKAFKGSHDEIKICSKNTQEVENKIHSLCERVSQIEEKEEENEDD